MTVTNYTQWVADGSPWHDCQPTKSFYATLHASGYSGPSVGIGDQSHLTAAVPEDHCPYSHTPWPNPQPYPAVMAWDIMPNEGLNLVDLGGKIFDAKMSGDPGLAALKYMNWTDSAGNCFHDSWQPNHTRYNSSDRGHIHLSWRTDFVNASVTFDPYGSGGGSGTMLCNYGDGNSGTPSEIVRALQYQLLQLDPTILPKFGPDGGYGDETARAVSILVTGGDGRHYQGQAFAILQQLIATKFGPAGGGGTLVPHTHALSVSVSGTTTGSGSGTSGAAVPS